MLTALRLSRCTDVMTKCSIANHQQQANLRSLLPLAELHTLFCDPATVFPLRVTLSRFIVRVHLLPDACRATEAPFVPLLKCVCGDIQTFVTALACKTETERVCCAIGCFLYTYLWLNCLSVCL